MNEYLHVDVTGRVLGAAFDVHKSLGPGFLESVYEEALSQELRLRQISYQRQVEVPIHYKGVVVGIHRIDLIVEDKVVVELKAVRELVSVHTAIVISYLKASNLSVGLLLNFALASLEYKRIAH